MAELCARQGRTADAIGIYRRLLTSVGGETVQPSERAVDPRRAKWAARLAALEGGGGGAASPPPAGPGGTRGAAPPPSRARPAAAPPEPEISEVDDTMIVAAVAEEEPEVAVSPVRRHPLLVEGPVRSGQVIYAQDRDLIVLAGVNPGAQLIADGHIHIYGPLRGRAVAGAHGWLEARIFCQRLEAELVGVDAAYLTSEDLPRDRLAKAAQISIRDGRCVVAGF